MRDCITIMVGCGVVFRLICNLLRGVIRRLDAAAINACLEKLITLATLPDS